MIKRLKRSVGFLLSLLIVAGMFAAMPTTVFAAETSGDCGDSATWRYDADSKTLYFEGTGAIWDFENAGNYRVRAFATCDAETVVFGDGITRIGESTMKNFYNLTTVTMGNDITSIGEQAFYDCNKLSSVTFSNTLHTIESKAFYLCYHLTSLDFPDSLQSIGSEAFYACRRIESIRFPANLTVIANEGFSNCNALKAVDLSNTKVQTIGDNAFDYCNAMETLSFPGMLKTIGEKAFNCSNTKLTTVTIPASVTLIQFDAFKGCRAVTDVYCYPDPSAFNWWEKDCDDFKDGKATLCHVPHAYLDSYNAKFNNGTNDVNVTFTFADDHIYGDPVWTWTDDYSSATAEFTCTYTDCGYEETVDATVTSETNDGNTVYTATAEIGGSTYTDTKTIYADGMSARLVGHSLSLKGNIGVNFYMDLDESVADSETAYMYFTIPGNTVTYQKVYVNEQSDASLPFAEKKAVGSKTYYVFPCSVAAKEMTSIITAQIQGTEQQGTIYTYSVQQYADYLLAHANEKEEWAAAAPLVEKMIQYGAYAKEYFDKTDTLGNLEDAAIDIADPVIGEFPEGTTFEGATLSLKSETTLSIYFKSSTTLTFSCADYHVETVTSGSYQVARIRGIKAKHIGSIITVDVNGVTVKYSPLNYCKNVLTEAASSPDELKPEGRRHVNVVKALYVYWLAADRYFD